MPAPDYQTLNAFADNIVFAAVAGFRADNLPNTYGNRGTEELPKERIDLFATGFAKASEQMVQDSGGTWHDCHYAGTITATVISPRGDPEAAARHRARIGRATYLLSREAQLFTSTNLPYYEVLVLELVATSDSVDDETDTDRTELTFACAIGIRASAFPV